MRILSADEFCLAATQQTTRAKRTIAATVPLLRARITGLASSDDNTRDERPLLIEADRMMAQAHDWAKLGKFKPHSRKFKGSPHRVRDVPLLFLAILRPGLVELPGDDP
jgi:hypothetical protein